jgi:molybdate transport system ATP-binding protein
MDLKKHFAVSIAPNCNYNWVIENILNGNLLQPVISLSGLQGALYADAAVNTIIAEELLHDKFEITTPTNSSLKSMSSGEQKKALLQYIIGKKPGFIVVDNIPDNLDAGAQQNITTALQQIAAHTIIIQIIHRKKDLLPFITDVVTLNNNTLFKQQSITEYLQIEYTNNKNYFTANIPPALQHYNLPAGPLVQLTEVSVSYEGRPVLHNINWTIHPGEFWQLTGQNGTGKSTILSLITGDNPKAYGQNLLLFGYQKGSGESVWDIKKYIGYLTPNMAQFFPRLDSVEKMLLSGFFDSVGLYTRPNETQIKTAHQWLQFIGLYDYKNEPFCFLPLGKQRMVLVARAMVKHPPLLILDEPTAGLDDDSAAIFTTLINAIAAKSTTAIIYVSHQKEEGLNPQHIFKLTAAINGSEGIVLQ